jgi:hypothetical protein
MNETVFVFASLFNSDAGKAYTPGVIDQGERSWSIDAYVGPHRLEMRAFRITA